MKQRESRLTRGVERRDVQACGDVITTYSAKLYGLFFQLTGRTEVSEDLVQETFLKIWRSLESFRAQSSLSTWIYRIAINTFHDHLRGERRNPAAMSVCSELENREGNPAPPLDQTLRKEELSRLADAVGQLPMDLKLPLVLRYYHSLPVRHVAVASGLSYGQTKFRLKKALASLRRLLKA